ncbi:winged helix DNA-binding domain-containing protein [Actinoplanes sp. NPDC049265]|uniref:winged helix DNA-binding domain-containing protein n=1 Tax=Actinoplanes sp. NPDC049265 TaxID=3363902 RepID=UPI0037139E13
MAVDSLALRLHSLLLRDHPGVRPTDVAGVVRWFGAMQAQDMASALWSLGARLPGWTSVAVSAALEDRSVVRTWPMRGTVHLVPSADAQWMLALMGVRALAGVAKRREIIGLSEAAAERGVAVLGEALAGGGRMTRAECLRTLTEAGVDVSGQRGYHMLWYASQQGVTAIAPHVGKEQTFVLLSDWAPSSATPDRAEALGIIALRYFRSHGPATVADLARWTGLTVRDCRAGVAAAGDALATADGLTVDAALRDFSPPVVDDWLALPGFDEYMLGYKDRSLMLSDPDHLNAVVPGGNGVFQATVVRAGVVVATWKRTLRSSSVVVEVQPLDRIKAGDRKHVAAALQPYADFQELTLDVRWP